MTPPYCVRLTMRAEPHARLLLHVIDQPLEQDDAGAVPDNVRMHREHERGAFFIRLIEFVHPNLQKLIRRAVTIAAWVEQWGVVVDPLDWKFDDTRWLSVGHQLVR